ncbi:pyruvate dehydrogenase (acetyl-transferring) E1 component subunit alpha [Halospeciosus flavus]|uniref:Pyruvate dehydrogenase (Acetyl-transferring) E1 component subunit alpha n=1 Tax=Halospeciosus flavus TaxID=3032283 RepID=A0ABD5Z0Q8_9EURY|nr:pyruvate dehydrogenase (acetyl-transferring) E1 component subunit alpha [Halospeciosus flavus]
MSHAGPDVEFDNQVLDADGNVVAPERVPDCSDEEFVEMYRWMKFARRFDERGVSLQRQGRMGTFSALTGHEAALVGSEAALADDDWLVPYYRDHAATMAHGLPPERILQYYMGHEAGSIVPEDVNVFPISITIGGHLPHAVGLAHAAKLRGTDEVFCCYFGDGATSEGDFHEALNFAGVFDTPNVFFCMNNQWAISTPVEQQMATDTIAQKATAYGFEGVRVDGTDPLAVYNVTREAAARAREDDPADGERRPTLVEAVLYRVGAHNTTDDPSNYHRETDAADLERWRDHDPLPRFETFLRESGRLDDERVAAIDEWVEEELERAVDAAEATTPDPDELFEFAYADQPSRVREQQAELAALRERYGDDALLED